MTVKSLAYSSVARGRRGLRYILFSIVRFPAVSRAFEASRGRLVKTTDAAMVSGASVLSSSSIILSAGD